MTAMLIGALQVTTFISIAIARVKLSLLDLLSASPHFELTPAGTSPALISCCKWHDFREYAEQFTIGYSPKTCVHAYSM